MMRSELVYIKHANKLSDSESRELYSFLTGFAERQGRTIGLEMLSVDVDVHMKDGIGKRKKYSMNATLHTKEGKYRDSAYGWSVLEAAKELEVGLRKQATKHKGKNVSILHHIRGLLKQ